MSKQFVVGLHQLGMADVSLVGGKNASLGEMIAHLSAAGIGVPGGFATTTAAFHAFLQHNDLSQRIDGALASLDVDDIQALTTTGTTIRQWILEAAIPNALEQAVLAAYQALLPTDEAEVSFAVRSSATAEDLPDASFAGQQESYLNVIGEGPLLAALKKVYASLYNDRAIAYRVHQGFEHGDVAISAGVQRMVRSDRGASGVMFTIDTESGFSDVVFITSSYGLGETLVQGAVNPDEFYVYKPNLKSRRPAILRRSLGGKAIKMIYGESLEQPTQTVDVPSTDRDRFSLTDDDVEQLARYATAIESHYRCPMDIEWAKDGTNGQLYILQARPETVESRKGQVIERYRLEARSDVLVTGRSIGQRIGQGPVRIIQDVSEMDKVAKGDVLVTDMTDPDWEPVMKRAAAIVTNRGGRTCHAAIIARELGIPAVVGTDDGTESLSDDQPVTVSCAEGDTGKIYTGLLDYQLETINLGALPEAPLKIMLNVGNPDRAFAFAALPNHGVGLARLEFLINRVIGIHPKALLEYSAMPEPIQKDIQQRTTGYRDPVAFYVEKLTEGIAQLGAAFAPKPVIVRLSDFKSNEYQHLLGGNLFEPKEENPMLGFRGAGRYIADSFQECFALECRALRKVRDEMGLTNVEIMVPFVRTVDEAKQVVTALESHGLKRGENGLRVIMMCEIPSNCLLADQFLEHFDGFSIGSNDLTQLTLGLDRDSSLVAERFDERDPAVKALLSAAIRACRSAGKYIGICGQGPSDHPDLAKWLLAEGIESVSLNPDTVVETWLYLADGA